MEDAGTDRKHAEAVAATAGEAAGSAAAAALSDRTDMATKADLAAMKAGLATMESRMLERIQASERRTYAAVFAAAGLLFAALKLVP